MSLQPAWQLSFGFLGSKPVLVQPVEELLTSDAGLLPIREFDEQLDFAAQFVAAIDDPRQPHFVTHCYAEMVRMRIYGILAGYADQNDHDLLRYDPVFKLLAGRRPSDHELASQPTLSRFENAISVRSLRRLQKGRYAPRAYRNFARGTPSRGRAEWARSALGSNEK